MSQDPLRLDLAGDAPAAAVEALRLARRDAPDAARLAAIEAAVLVKLAPPDGGGDGGGDTGGGDAGGTSTGEGSAGGAAGGGAGASSLSPMAKAGAAALAAGAAVVAVVLATRPAPPPVVARSTPSVAAPLTAPSTAASPSSEEPPTLAVGDLPSAPDPSGAARRPLEAPQPAASAAADPADGERVEVSLLDRAQASLAGRPADALASCDEHARRFPRGTLVQEREVLAIDALLRLGRREEAEARAARFRQAFPRSGHLRRVEALLSR